MPDVATRLVEGRLDPGDLTRQRRDHVLGRILDIPRRTLNRVAVSIVLVSREYDAETIAHRAIVLHHSLRDQIDTIAGRSHTVGDKTIIVSVAVEIDLLPADFPISSNSL